MASFTDAQSREWQIFIDVPTVKKLKQHKLDILAIFTGKMEVFEQVIGDPIQLVDTLWIVCEDQIRERGIDEVGFAKALYGDALMNAAEALVEGVCTFFPNPKQRAALRALLRKSKEVGDLMIDQAMKQIEGMNLDDLAKALETEYTEKSSELLDSSVSTPA